MAEPGHRTTSYSVALIDRNGTICVSLETVPCAFGGLVKARDAAVLTKGCLSLHLPPRTSSFTASSIKKATTAIFRERKYKLLGVCVGQTQKQEERAKRGSRMTQENSCTETRQLDPPKDRVGQHRGRWKGTGNQQGEDPAHDKSRVLVPPSSESSAKSSLSSLETTKPSGESCASARGRRGDNSTSGRKYPLVTGTPSLPAATNANILQ